MRIFVPFIFSLLLVCQTQELNGEDLFEQGKFVEAVRFYTSIIASKGFDPEIVYNRGRAYEEMGDKKVAKADYDLVI